MKAWMKLHLYITENVYTKLKSSYIEMNRSLKCEHLETFNE